jgi:cobalamin biosynthesis Mg chelatase CobN
MEAFCMGFNACRDGLRHDDGEAFIAGLTAAWERTGGEQARRVFAALTDPDAALAALPEEDQRRYRECQDSVIEARRSAQQNEGGTVIG